MRYCFYSEYRDIKGGYTTLIITLISQLHAKKRDVVLLNYKDGLIASELRRKGIEITIVDKDEIDQENIAHHFLADDIFILPKFYEYLNVLLSVNPKIIYYDINDYICQISYYRGLSLPALGKKMVKRLLEKNSIIFMDDTGVFNLKQGFNIHIQNPQILPVSISVETENRLIKPAINVCRPINVSYVGRSVAWKLFPLRKVIEDSIHTDEKLHFHILVDDVTNFHKVIHLEKYQDKNIFFTIYDSIQPSGISSFLKEHSDISFAMGTTALHSASLGIPTILLDYSDNLFPGKYFYRWLHTTLNYSLGRNIDKLAVQSGMSLKEVFDEIRNQETAAKVSKQVFDYVAKNHCADKVVDRLIQYCERSEAHLADIRPYFAYFFKAHNLLKKVKATVNL